MGEKTTLAFGVCFYTVTGFLRHRLRFLAVCISCGWCWELRAGKHSLLCCNETGQFLGPKLQGHLCSGTLCLCTSSWCCVGAL